MLARRPCQQADRQNLAATSATPGTGVTAWRGRHGRMTTGHNAA